MLTLTAAIEPEREAGADRRREITAETTSFEDGREALGHQVPQGWKIVWIRTS